MSVYRNNLPITDSQTAPRVYAQRECQATSRRLFATLFWCGFLHGGVHAGQTATSSPALVGNLSSSLPTIVINIDDQYGKPSDTRRFAQAEAVRIFAAAKVRAIWVDGLAADNDDTLLPHVVVAILAPRTERKLTWRAIHRSVVGVAARGGNRAYIFYERLAYLARLRDRPVGTVIGMAIAHEVGHLLLSEHAHSRAGIMRADLDLRAPMPQEFTSGQAAAIRRRLERDKSLSLSAGLQ